MAVISAALAGSSTGNWTSAGLPASDYLSGLNESWTGR